MSEISIFLIFAFLYSINLSCSKITSEILSLFIKKRGAQLKKIKWEDKGPTPLGDKKFTPQGLTWVDSKLIFANSWKDEKSRVYEIDPSTMKILRYFDMPQGAVHTSGLAWDGNQLWAVDYISNRAYCIELEASLSSSHPHVIGSFDTTLQGTSACCIIQWNKQQYLAVSDFRNTCTTIFIDISKALKTGTAKGAIDFKYINECFSQGLEFFNGFLYESENKFGKNIINKIDLTLLSEYRNSRKSTIVQFVAPSWGIEDLAWDGEALWTSEERTFRFFKTFLN